MKPYNPGSPALANSEELWLKRRSDSEPTRFEVEHARPYKKIFLVGLVGIDSLTALEPWFKSEISVDRATLPSLSEEELYDFEAIGLEVRTIGGETVGIIREVMPMPAGDVWVVEATRNGSLREILVPVAEPIVREIDLAEGVALIDPPPGLLELD